MGAFGSAKAYKLIGFYSPDISYPDKYYKHYLLRIEMLFLDVLKNTIIWYNNTWKSNAWITQVIDPKNHFVTEQKMVDI